MYTSPWLEYISVFFYAIKLALKMKNVARMLAHPIPSLTPSLFRKVSRPADKENLLKVFFAQMPFKQSPTCSL
jgi:hypothetical protein